MCRKTVSGSSLRTGSRTSASAGPLFNLPSILNPVAATSLLSSLIEAATPPLHCVMIHFELGAFRQHQPNLVRAGEVVLAKATRLMAKKFIPHHRDQSTDEL